MPFDKGIRGAWLAMGLGLIACGPDAQRPSVSEAACGQASGCADASTGQAGADAPGDASGEAGSAGEGRSGGSGGAAGAMNPMKPVDGGPACMADCKGNTPYCDPQSGKCVACLFHEQCTGDPDGPYCVDQRCATCELDAHCSQADSRTPHCVGARCVQCGSDDHCGDEAPFCVGNACVQCASDDHCAAGVPFCVDEHCVECASDDHCAGEAPHCVDSKCVECTGHADCRDPAAARCDSRSHRCVACEHDDQCAGVSAGGTALELCDAGACVECTRTRFEACGTADDGAPYVCDSLRQRCSGMTQASQGLCATCVSDAACRPGMRCMEERFAGASIGHVCLWEVGASNQGPDDCAEARPYVQERVDARSIDGVQADVCALSATTCAALTDFRGTRCEGPDDGTACGVEAHDDALCRPFTASSFRCTTPCLSSDDCRPGSACNTQAQAPYCDLQTNTCFTGGDCPPGLSCDRTNHTCTPREEDD